MLYSNNKHKLSDHNTGQLFKRKYNSQLYVIKSIEL